MLLSKKKICAMLTVALMISSIFVITVDTIAAGREREYVRERFVEATITYNHPPKIILITNPNPPRWLWTGDIYSIRVKINDNNGLWDINTTDIRLQVNNTPASVNVIRESGTPNEIEGIFRLDFYVTSVLIGNNTKFNVKVTDRNMSSNNTFYNSTTFFNPVSTFNVARPSNFQITDTANQTNNIITIRTTNTAGDLPMRIDVRADNLFMINNPKIFIDVRNIKVTNQNSGNEFTLSNSYKERIDTLRGSASNNFIFNLRDQHVPKGSYRGQIFFRMTYDLN